MIPLAPFRSLRNSGCSNWALAFRATQTLQAAVTFSLEPWECPIDFITLPWGDDRSFWSLRIASQPGGIRTPLRIVRRAAVDWVGRILPNALVIYGMVSFLQSGSDTRNSTIHLAQTVNRAGRWELRLLDGNLQ